MVAVVTVVAVVAVVAVIAVVAVVTVVAVVAVVGVVAVVCVVAVDCLQCRSLAAWFKAFCKCRLQMLHACEGAGIFHFTTIIFNLIGAATAHCVLAARSCRLRFHELSCSPSPTATYFVHTISSPSTRYVTLQQFHSC